MNIKTEQGHTMSVSEIFTFNAIMCIGVVLVLVTVYGLRKLFVFVYLGICVCV